MIKAKLSCPMAIHYKTGPPRIRIRGKTWLWYGEPSYWQLGLCCTVLILLQFKIIQSKTIIAFNKFTRPFSSILETVFSAIYHCPKWRPLMCRQTLNPQAPGWGLGLYLVAAAALRPGQTCCWFEYFWVCFVTLGMFLNLHSFYWSANIPNAGDALGIWICGCSLFYKRELWASKSAGAQSTKSLKRLAY